MSKKARSSGERAQVSLEILMLLGVIIMLSIAVFSYYTQIRDTTTAMQMFKVEVLKQVEEADEQYIIEKIEYKIDAGKINLCVFTDPEFTDLDSAAVLDKVAENTAFDAADITIYSNPNPNSCE